MTAEFIQSNSECLILIFDEKQTVPNSLQRQLQTVKKKRWKMYTLP